MNLNVVILFVIIHSKSVFTTIIFDIDPDYKTCPGVVNDLFDISKMEVIAVNDNENFLNGSFKILHPIKAPFKGSFTTTRLIRGQWVKAEINRQVSDLCSAMINPVDIVYRLLKNVKSRCPVKAGVKLIN